MFWNFDSDHYFQPEEGFSFEVSYSLDV